MTTSGRTETTKRYEGLPNAMRNWAVPFAKGEDFTLTLETPHARRVNDYTSLGQLVRTR